MSAAAKRAASRATRLAAFVATASLLSFAGASRAADEKAKVPPSAGEGSLPRVNRSDRLFGRPEPAAARVRIKGRVSEAGTARGLKLLVGSGPRGSPHERRRLETLATSSATLPPTGDGEPFGLDLPPSPETWEAVNVESDGSFLTPPVPADPPPQLLAFDVEGRVGLQDVPVPGAIGGTAEAATVETEPIVLAPAVALEVDVQLPQTDLPLVLSLGLAGVSVSPDERDAVTRRLAALDRIDGRLFDLFTARATIPLPFRGTLRLAGLPPFASLDLFVVGPHPGLVVKRTLALTRGAPTKLRIGEDDLLSGRRAEATAVLAGRLVLEGTARPVSGATVVFSDYPDRRETKTDAKGRFRFPNVRRGSSATLFVDARASGVGRAHAPTHSFRDVPIPAAAGATGAARTAVLALPARKFREGASLATASPGSPVQPNGPPKGPPGGPEAPCFPDGSYFQDEQYPTLATLKLGVQGEAAWDALQAWAYDPSSGVAQITEPNAGDRTVLFAFTPFVISILSPVSFPDGQLTQNVRVFPPAVAPIDAAFVQFFRRGGGTFPAANVAVYFPTLVHDPDPVVGVTDENGVVKITCINQNPIFAFVDDPNAGTFDGEIRWPQGSNFKVITLQ